MIGRLTIDDFEKTLSQQKGPLLLKFGSETCAPCRAMGPVMQKLAKNNPLFPIFEIDTQSDPELADFFKINSVPTLLYIEQKEILYGITGTTPLSNLQFVIDHIHDPYFRAHGRFKAPAKKGEWIFFSIVFLVVALFVALIYGSNSL